MLADRTTSSSVEVKTEARRIRVPFVTATTPADSDGRESLFARVVGWCEASSPALKVVDERRAADCVRLLDDGDRG
jgi:hypothetical protein